MRIMRAMVAEVFPNLNMINDGEEGNSHERPPLIGGEAPSPVWPNNRINAIIGRSCDCYG
jgi:hypothetical protein